MGNRLNGKRCLVTGAAQGIGLAIAQAFARESALVLATDVRLDALQAAGLPDGVRLGRLDVTDASAAGEAVRTAGRIDVLVNCAGFKAAPNRFAYAASKAVVLAMTRCIALDYVGKGIRCNSISPGTVDTPSLHERIAAGADPELLREQMIARQPMGRFGASAEVAEAAVFLASDEARFMTGADLAIDGGMSL